MPRPAKKDKELLVRKDSGRLKKIKKNEKNEDC